MKRSKLKIWAVNACMIVLAIQVKSVFTIAAEEQKPVFQKWETAKTEETEVPENQEEEKEVFELDPGSYLEPFNAVSVDDITYLDDFKVVEIPEDYKQSGGCFPVIVQMYTYQLCHERHISYPLVVAMIERESGYTWNIKGDSEQSYGYMQTKQIYNQERADNIGDGDLLNPYTNITVGVDILDELFAEYTDVGDVLMAYNCGETKAAELWSQGIHSTDYTRTVLERASDIEQFIYGGEWYD